MKPIEISSETAGKIEADARGLAAMLPGVLHLVNSWVPGIQHLQPRQGVYTAWGLITYVAVRRPSDGPVAVPRIDRYFLVAAIPPSASLDALLLFPVILRRCASLLGTCSSPEKVTERRAESVKTPEGKLKVVARDVSPQHLRGALHDARDAPARLGTWLSDGLTPGTVVTLSWPASDTVG